MRRREHSSFALICHDPDVPSKGDDVNQEDRTVPASLARGSISFTGCCLICRPHSARSGQANFPTMSRHAASPVRMPRTTHARESMTTPNWFAGDNDMRGDYYGYDGPCPPWNDEIVHRYVFTLFALDVDRLDIEGKLTGQQVRAAMQGHILRRSESDRHLHAQPGAESVLRKSAADQTAREGSRFPRRGHGSRPGPPWPHQEHQRCTHTVPSKHSSTIPWPSGPAERARQTTNTHSAIAASKGGSPR
jgi:Raf kinase inhibitor-like YbhB/YbcL family protein